jgi:DNA invertase Pin-like site-specific DNA recombinase
VERRALVVLMGAPLTAEAIRALAKEHAGNVSAMAAAVGLHRCTLHKKIRKLKLGRELAKAHPRAGRQPDEKKPRGSGRTKGRAIK